MFLLMSDVCEALIEEGRTGGGLLLWGDGGAG